VFSPDLSNPSSLIFPQCPENIDEASYEDIPEDEEKNVFDNLKCYRYVDAQIGKVPILNHPL
jgi:hypothetical protein